MSPPVKPIASVFTREMNITQKIQIYMYALKLAFSDRPQGQMRKSAEGVCILEAEEFSPRSPLQCPVLGLCNGSTMED